MLQAIISSTDPSRHDRGQRCLMFGACLRAESGISRHRRNAGRDPCPVSYTHPTLPTSDLV